MFPPLIAPHLSEHHPTQRLTAPLSTLQLVHVLHLQDTGGSYTSLHVARCIEYLSAARPMLLMQASWPRCYLGSAMMIELLPGDVCNALVNDKHLSLGRAFSAHKRGNNH